MGGRGGTAALPLYHGPCTGRETPPTPDYISAENGEINQSVIFRDPRSDTHPITVFHYYSTQ